MPWQPDGTFLRVNPDYTGNVWEKDQQAAIKIIATRHDFHDGDMASGIERCLNLDGYNKMAAALDMNNFAVVNLLTGSLASDATRYDQVFDNLDYNDVSGVLTLSRPNGADLTTIIAATGGGGGTVTSIAGSPGRIITSPDPISSTGTIDMATVHGGLNGSNGIASIAVDAYGRVTSIVGDYGSGYVTNPPNDGKVYGRQYTSWVEIITGGGGDQTLSLSMDSNSADITISGGNTISIPLATASVAGLLSPAENNKLADLPGNGSLYDAIHWNGSSWVAGSTLQINPSSPGIVVNGQLLVSSSATISGALGANGQFTAETTSFMKGLATFEANQLLKSTSPYIEWEETDSVANEGKWRLWASTPSGSGELGVYGLSDTDVLGLQYFRFRRNAQNIEFFDAVGGAQFTEGGVPVLTQTPMIDLINELELSGALSPAVAAALIASL